MGIQENSTLRGFTFRSLSAFVTDNHSSVQTHRMGKRQDNSQCTMLPFEGTEGDLMFFSPCFSLQRVTGKQRATKEQNRGFAALAEC